MSEIIGDNISPGWKKGKGENESIEVGLLIEGIYRKYGYDFSRYSGAFIKRRIMRRLALEALETISELQHRILYDQDLFERFLLDFSINVTEMFRDPTFFRTIRDTVVPRLKELSHIKIWHAGCASGEEVYSMAILLTEEGLYDRSIIYATDFNEVVIQNAKEGIYPNNLVKKYTSNYHRAGGMGSFSDYYTADDKFAIISKSLKKNIVFASHNLVSDGVFGEMSLIMCRNVLIYFNRTLQDHVLGLFLESLDDGGILCLGSRESADFSKYADSFIDLVRAEKIYRKKGGGPPARSDHVDEPAEEGEVRTEVKDDILDKGSKQELHDERYEAIVIGVSAGGMNALKAILPSLPADFPLPLIVVQHLHETSDNFLASFLNDQCHMMVKEADEKEQIRPGTIYIAPPRYHLMIEADRTFSLSVDEPVSFARPSIDVLFETAADVYGAGLIGVILTGANSDGSMGIKKIKDMGGLAIVQDPGSAEIDAMPKSAMAAAAIDHVIDLDGIGIFLKRVVTGEGDGES